MSIHIGAKQGEIAEIVLLPGDPLRAKHIAQTFLDNPVCYTEVRGMLGFTGTYQGTKISVQGTGMGVPSHSIYVHELLHDYGAKTLIRVGTCGALNSAIHLRDIVIAMSASNDSQINRLQFHGIDYAPTANFDLLHKAYQAGISKGLPIHVGNIFTSDVFYREDQALMQTLIDHHTLAVEMETAALYTLAARVNAKALTILTVSDHILTGEATTADERQQTFNEMIEVALAAAIQ
nr:purine-nucleoside phosphorylase [Bacilli bacterium]